MVWKRQIDESQIFWEGDLVKGEKRRVMNYNFWGFFIIPAQQAFDFKL